MVLCLLAIPLFLVLGIFSAKYRQLAKDALKCIGSTVTLKKCESGLDDRIRAEITGRLLSFAPRTASFVYRSYKILSWIVLLLFIWSAYQTAISGYNYYNYGSCNEPAGTGFCLLNPSGAGQSDIDTLAPESIIQPDFSSADFIRGNPNATLSIIEFGCYACPYTKKAEPIVQEVLDYYKGKVNLHFKTFLIPRHNMSYSTALSAYCAAEQGAYESYHKELFANQEKLNNQTIADIAQTLNLNLDQFNECRSTQKYKSEIENATLMGKEAGVLGTPTFFINGHVIAGPKPFKTFKTVINEALKNVQP